MTRRDFTIATKRAAWERCGGKCEGCGQPFDGRQPEYDHIVADNLGGSNTLENAAVLCPPCHRIKTGKHDIPRIAKVKRIQHGRANLRPKSSFAKRRYRNHEKGADRW